MRRSIACMLALVVAAVVVRSQSAVDIQIDVAASRRPIDARIYGVAFADAASMADLRIPVNRWGGNSTSRYNWQANGSNRASDWYFESIADSSAVAGDSADSFIAAAKSSGTEPLMTIPTIGWVAKFGPNRSKLSSFSIAKYGPQTGADFSFPDAGNGVSAATGQPITGNDPNDANVAADAAFQQGWVQHLVTRWGTSATGGLRYYTLDNEPSIWQSTHRDVHPTGPTMDEVFNDAVTYATQIKAVDPGALILGPEEWGWSGYFYSGYDLQWGGAHGWNNLPDRTAHGNADYLPWYLDQLRQHDTATGQRLLDIFSVHFYPQGGQYSNDTSTAMQQLRNRSTRALWDPGYVDESWIGTQVQLVPRLKSWAATYYPGTKVGITEYNWGAEGHINGATTQADILGIFGREGLDLATLWTTPAASSPTYKAIKLYRNYDGQGSGFGDTSVSAVAPSPDLVSVFAAQRTAGGTLTVMAVNKDLSSSPLVNFHLANFTAGGPVQVWQLTASNAITRLADATVSGSTVAVPLPPQSITMLVIASSASAGTSIAATAGTPQSTTANASFATALQATVRDAASNPVSGATVTFAAPGSGASARFNGLSTATAVTNASGVATASALTANGLTGSYAVTASVAGAATAATFSLTNNAGPAASVNATRGTPQSTTVNTVFATGLQATVLDAISNPVTGVTVTFTAPGSGASASFSGAATATAVTNASGVATAPALTATSQAGSYAVTASVVGVAAGAAFSLTNSAASSGGSVSAYSGTPQSATVNTTFGVALRAWVRDAAANAVSGARVTFTAPASGPSARFSGGATATAVSDANGLATAPSLTSTSQAGSYTVTASVAGVTTPASFSLTNNGAASVRAFSGTPQSTATNTAFGVALVAWVLDAGNHGIGGVTVTFTAPAGAASAAFGGAATATAVTNGSGTATAPALTANGQAGSYAVTATVPGVATGAAFTLTNTGLGGSSVSASAGTPQSASVSTTFAASLQATVRDAGSNPMSGVTVTFTAPGSGATARFSGAVTATAVTTAGGIATAPALTATSQAGSYTVMASAAGVATAAAFNLTNSAAVAASVSATAGTPQSTAVSTAFATPLQATVRDAGSNPLNGVTVTFTAPGTGASASFSGAATATAVTNASGVATAPALTATSQAGSYTVTASVVGVATRAAFSVTNSAGAAASVSATAGTPQSAVVSTAFATSLEATVRDAGSNPVTGVTVTFTAPGSGASASFSGAATATAVTNASGVATAPALTATSQAGSYTVTASVVGVAAGAAFSLTNSAASSGGSVSAYSGTPQSATVNTTFGVALRAWVRDAAANAVSGARVTFTAPASGPSARFSGGATATAVSDANGLATAPALTSTSQAGSYTVTASVAGVTTPASFSLTNNGAASVRAFSGTPQSTTTNTTFGVALVAWVLDAGNHGIGGVTVTFTAPAGTASAEFGGAATATAITNGRGTATAPALTANGQAGSYAVTAMVPGVATGAAFTLTNTGSGSSSVSASAGTPQSAAVSTAFATSLQATVRDAGSNPMSGVTVTFTAPGSGASAGFSGAATATVVTTAGGIATAPALTATSQMGSYTVMASAAGVATGGAFNLTNTASASSGSVNATSGTPQSATVSSAFALALQATVRDAGSNPMSGVTVTFTAPGAGASAGFGGAATATAVTTATGIATAPALTANGQPGSYTVTASVAGVTTPAAFALTNNSGTSGGGVWTNQAVPVAVNTCSGTGVGSVMADPVRPSDYYALVCQDNSGATAVLKSADFGQSWTNINRTPGSVMTGRPWGASIDPNPNRNPNTPPTMYTPSGYGSLGLFKSTDGGVTWAQLFTGSTVFDPYSPFGLLPDVYSVSILPDNPPNHILITFHAYWKNSSDAGFGESTDGGVTWTVHQPPGGIGQSHYLMIVDATTWLSVAQDNGGANGIWKTSTAGRTGGAPSTSAWRKVDTLEHVHGSFQGFVDTANGALYAPGLHGIRRSADRGETWAWAYQTVDYISNLVSSGNYIYGNYLYGPELIRSSRTDGTSFTSYTTAPGGMAQGSAPMGSASSFNGTNWVIVSGNQTYGLWRYVQ